jgi:hypothetical protein
MSYPRKFGKLLEVTLSDVEQPDYVWITYAVCACSEDSCGWGGWIIDGVFAKSVDKQNPTATGDKPLPADDVQKCPRCGKDLFRTEASIRFVPSTDQTRPEGTPGVDYDVALIEYNK